jgi:hypothetical protein
MNAERATPSGSTRKLLGLGALACIACCIGPILGLLGAVGIATIAGTLTFGIAGLAIALLAIPLLRTRRAASRCAAPLPHEVIVSASATRRPH